MLTIYIGSRQSEELYDLSNDINESFGLYLYADAEVLDMLKGMLSAESYLCAYLDLPLTVRQCIEKP